MEELVVEYGTSPFDEGENFVGLKNGSPNFVKNFDLISTLAYRLMSHCL